MITTMVLVFVVFVACAAVMAVGVMAGKAPIAGSCGGISAALGQSHTCSLCGKHIDAPGASPTPSRGVRTISKA